jgi:hypothetical protein
MKIETRYLVSYRRRVLFTQLLNAAPLQSGFGFCFFPSEFRLIFRLKILLANGAFFADFIPN